MKVKRTDPLYLVGAIVGLAVVGAVVGVILAIMLIGVGLIGHMLWDVLLHGWNLIT